MAPESQKTPHR